MSWLLLITRSNCEQKSVTYDKRTKFCNTSSGAKKRIGWFCGCSAVASVVFGSTWTDKNHHLELKFPQIYLLYLTRLLIRTHVDPTYHKGAYTNIETCVFVDKREYWKRTSLPTHVQRHTNTRCVRLELSPNSNESDALLHAYAPYTARRIIFRLPAF